MDALAIQSVHARNRDEDKCSEGDCQLHDTALPSVLAQDGVKMELPNGSQAYLYTALMNVKRIVVFKKRVPNSPSARRSTEKQEESAFVHSLSSVQWRDRLKVGQIFAFNSFLRVILHSQDGFELHKAARFKLQDVH